MLANGDTAEHGRAAFRRPSAVLASIVPQDPGPKCRWVGTRLGVEEPAILRAVIGGPDYSVSWDSSKTCTDYRIWSGYSSRTSRIIEQDQDVLFHVCFVKFWQVAKFSMNVVDPVPFH